MVAARRALARMVDTLTDARPLHRLRLRRRASRRRRGCAATGLVAGDRPQPVPRGRVPGAGSTRAAAPRWPQPLDRAVPSCLADAERRRATACSCWSPTARSATRTRSSRTLGERLARHARLHAGHRPGGQRGVPAPAGRRWAAASCELVESEDRLDEVMEKIHRRDRHAGADRAGARAGGLRGRARQSGARRGCPTCSPARRC